MTVMIKDGCIMVAWNGSKYESRPTGYYKNGNRISLDELPVQVRYLMSTTAEEADL